MNTNEILSMCLAEWGYPKEAENVIKGDDILSYSDEFRLINQLKKFGLIIDGNFIDSDDVDRLARDIDVYLNGEDGPDKQVKLCDIAAQLKREYQKRGVPVLSDNVDELKEIIFEAYIIVGNLLFESGQFDSEKGQAILDNLSQAKRIHKNLIPWGSFKESNHD